MKNNMTYKKTVMLLEIFLISLATTAQTTKENPIKDYETCIINKTIPTDHYDYKYEDKQRIIVWNDKLISDYKYTNEVFDKLGYDYIKTTDGDQSQSTKIYRNCDKGIIVEVTKWYDVKLSISMKWYPSSIRKSIGYLMYCGVSTKTESDKEKIAKGVYDLFKQDLIDKYTYSIVRYSDLKIKPILLTDDESIGKFKHFMKKYYYENILKNGSQSCFNIIINRNDSVELYLYNSFSGDTSLFMKNFKSEISSLNFSKPYAVVAGDTIYVKTLIESQIFYEKDTLGTIKIIYDKINKGFQIKNNSFDIENNGLKGINDLGEFLEGKESGKYKFHCYQIKIGLFDCEPAIIIDEDQTYKQFMAIQFTSFEE